MNHLSWLKDQIHAHEQALRKTKPESAEWLMHLHKLEALDQCYQQATGNHAIAPGEFKRLKRGGSLIQDFTKVHTSELTLVCSVLIAIVGLIIIFNFQSLQDEAKNWVNPVPSNDYNHHFSSLRIERP